ncbi:MULTISPECIES: hypothetical protein [Enterobacter cloacae complex]|uniref:hypothetical protein n=1 Tax=Enterobacter cloacae complex TaxID=354276 RepID=UPI001D07AA1A|nr:MULTISPECIES: hypothetical protein [Enterobacter cloacae complex]MCB7497669.1 hypothetical protein [Enterobacter roggenkampii]MCU3440537.1 hypothetical protein [Enterobacter asburiae]MDM8770149.1 hypothetical protein [Enterobacter kobei]
MDEKVMAIATLNAARDAADWAFWSMIGTWFAGVATFLAVLTSLYIAFRDKKSFIGGKVRLGHIFSDIDDKSVVAISVVNRSLHAVKLKSIFWEVNGDYEFQQLFRNPASDPLPIRLEHGDEAHYRIILNEDDDWLRRIAMRISKVNSSPERLRCVVALSTGERVRLKIDKRIKSKIKQFM